MDIRQSVSSDKEIDSSAAANISLCVRVRNKRRRDRNYRLAHASSVKRRKRKQYLRRVSSKKKKAEQRRTLHRSSEKKNRAQRYKKNSEIAKEQTKVYRAKIRESVGDNWQLYTQSESLKRRPKKQEWYEKNQAKILANKKRYNDKIRGQMYQERTRKIRTLTNTFYLGRALLGKYSYVKRRSVEWYGKCDNYRRKNVAVLFFESYKDNLPVAENAEIPTDADIRDTIQLRIRQVDEIRKVVIAALKRRFAQLQRFVKRISSEISQDDRANAERLEIALRDKFCGDKKKMYHVKSNEMYDCEKDRFEYFATLHAAETAKFLVGKKSKRNANRNKSNLDSSDKLNVSSLIHSTSQMKTPENKRFTPEKIVSSNKKNNSSVDGSTVSSKRPFKAIVDENSQETSAMKKKRLLSSCVKSLDDKSCDSYGSFSNDANFNLIRNISPTKSRINLSARFETEEKGSFAGFFRNVDGNNVTLNANLSTTDQIDFSTGFKSPTRTLIDKTPPISADSCSVTNKFEDKGKLAYRLCRCEFHENWAARFEQLLLQLVRVEDTYESLRDGLIIFDSCPNCDPSMYPHCTTPESCMDGFKLLGKMSCHCSKLRTMKRRMYEMRGEHIWLLRCECAKINGDWAEFDLLTTDGTVSKMFKAVESNSESRPNIWSYKTVKAEFKETFLEFDKYIFDFPTKFCHVCHEFRPSVKEFTTLEQFLAKKDDGSYAKPDSARMAIHLETAYAVENLSNETAVQLSQQADSIQETIELVLLEAMATVNDSDTPFFAVGSSYILQQPSATTTLSKIDESIENVIRSGLSSVGAFSATSNVFPQSENSDGNHLVSIVEDVAHAEDGLFKYRICPTCLSDMKTDQIPSCSDLNDMGVDPVPHEIAELNSTELMLIKLARTFQCVKRLTPMRQCGKTSDYVPALCGLAVHLPLPLEETHHYVKHTLPSTGNLEIVVDNIPSNKKAVWRSLVDMNKVKIALKKLIEINPLYKDVNNVFESKPDFTDFDDPPVHLIDSDLSTSIANEAVKSLLELSSDKSIYKNVSVVAIDIQMPNLDEVSMYKVNRVVASALSLKDSKLDMQCFPELYPRGRFGMFVERPKKVNPPKFLKNRLHNCDSRFRRDNQFLLQELHRYEDRAVQQGIYAVMNTSSLRNITAQHLQDQLNEKTQEMEANLSTLFSKVRGSKDFWRQKNGDLAAMDEKLGPATFFLTLSCAEYSWKDMQKYLEIMNEDLPAVEKIRISSLCVNDPVSVAIQFKRRIDAFKCAVFDNSKGPLGEVLHYFIRIEYQARGAPHAHIKVWVKDAPVVGSSSANDIQEFVEKHITCAVPSRAENPELRELVLGFQKHKCGPGCRRPFRLKGNKFITKCRHGFPRVASKEFKFISVEDSLASRKSARRRNEKLYTIRRYPEETHVNDYNPAILMLWKANVDLQFIGEKSNTLNGYISSYITKKEQNSTADLWAAISEKKSPLYTQLRQFARSNLQKREIGVYEAVDKLLGHPLFYSSDNIMYLKTFPYEKRKRRILPYKELQELLAKNPNSRNVYSKNLLDDYYINRPDELELVSLYEIATEYEFEKKEMNETSKKNKKMQKRVEKTNSEAGEPIHGAVFELKNNLGYFRKRGKPKILKTPRFSLKTEEGAENHFFALMMLFKPWRNENELLGDHPIYRAAYLACVDSSKEMEEFHQRKTTSETARELAIKLTIEAEEKASLEAEECIEDPQIDFEVVAEANEDNVDALYTPPSEEEFQKKLHSLNGNQKKAFDIILDAIRVQHDPCDTTRVPPINMVISGVAGTGKSFLIEVLTDAIHRMFPVEPDTLLHNSPMPPVVVLAPTGIAAFNVRGSTIHRYFKLNVQHGKDSELWELMDEDRKRFRPKWSALKLIIVDEFSMVSNRMLAKIHKRLSKVLDGKDFVEGFAGKNIVLFGDPLQLPPVRAKFCFQSMDNKDCKETFGSVGCFNLWDEFTYFELEENMRQKEDLAYAEMLNRIRIGSPTEEDVEHLKERLVDVPSYCNDRLTFIAKKFADDSNDEAKNSICLLPRNIQVDEFNQKMLALKNIEVVEILAADTGKHQKQKPRKSAKSAERGEKNVKQKKASDTAGLEECLKIGIGARIMLRRNLNVEQGLVNGALGTIVGIKNLNQRPYMLEVKFDSNGIIRPIEKVVGDFEISPGIFVSRKQFPICLAYAVTIHKSQGMTLDKILIDLGTSCFEDAMAYVALSRARQLKQVHLVDFEPTVIACKQIAVQEYIRLRATIALAELPPYNKMPAKYRTLENAAIVRPFIRSIGCELPKKAQTRKNTTSRESAYRKRKSVCNTTDCVWMKFKNPNVACYANSVVQSLLQFKDLAKHLSADHLSNQLRTFFTNLGVIGIRDDDAQSTHELRRWVAHLAGINGPNFELDGQQDVGEFLFYLLDFLPRSAKELMQFQQKITISCRNSSCFAPIAIVPPALLMQLELKMDSKQMEFGNMCKFPSTETLPGSFCLCGRPKQSETSIEILPQQTYLIVKMELFERSTTQMLGTQRIDNRRVTQFCANDTKICGKRFKLLAAIAHDGASAYSGHYTTWIRSSTGYVQISDDSIKASRRKFVDNLQDLCILFFEKI